MIPNLTKQATTNELVVASGFLFEEAIFEVATKYPDTHFIFIDGEPKNAATNEYEDLANVTSYKFAEAEAGYLAGVAAASTTLSNHVSFVGGVEIPPVQKFG